MSRFFATGDTDTESSGESSDEQQKPVPAIRLVLWLEVHVEWSSFADILVGIKFVPHCLRKLACTTSQCLINKKSCVLILLNFSRRQYMFGDDSDEDEKRVCPLSER